MPNPFGFPSNSRGREFDDLPDFGSVLRETEIRNRTTGLIPDQADFEADQAAKIENIIARLGLNREAFAGNLASRGLTLGGEVPRFLVRDIQAPALREAAAVTAESNLEFAKISSQVNLAVFQSMLNARLQEYLSKISYLTATDVANIQGQWALRASQSQNKSDLWRAFGGFAASYAAAGFPGLVAKAGQTAVRS